MPLLARLRRLLAWSRAKWTGAPRLNRALLALGLVIASPVLAVLASTGLAFEIVGRIDRRARLAAWQRWIVAASVVVGTLLIGIAWPRSASNNVPVSAAAASPGTPAATIVASLAPADTPTSSPSAPMTEVESSLLASMTTQYDDCSQHQPPSGTLVADITCTTIDGVTVEGSQYATAAAVTDAFATEAGAKRGTRCSAGAYLGDYRVAGKTSGQLGCNGTAATIAWTVPKLRLYLSATNLSMPELYAWWQHHWTVGSVASAATTGEKAVPVAVAVADTPVPADTPLPADTPVAAFDQNRDAGFISRYMASNDGITFSDSPLSDGRARLVGQDSTGLVIVELIEDPITETSVTAPIPGSDSGTDKTFATVLSTEEEVFQNPSGLNDWLFAQMRAAGPAGDRHTTRLFGSVLAHFDQDATTLGFVIITLTHG